MKITKTNEASAKGITMLVYGDSGTGKTTLLGTMPEEGTLILDVEGGVSVLAGKRIDTIRIADDLANLKDAFEYIQSDALKHTAVCLDSATELEAFMLQTLTQAKNREKPTLDEYGTSAYKMRQYMRVLRDLREKGVDVVVTALETPLELEAGNGATRTKLYPLMMRKLAPEVAGLFDIVAHMEVSRKEATKGKRFLRLDGDDAVLAKCRYAYTTPWAEADLTQFFSAIRNGHETK